MGMTPTEWTIAALADRKPGIEIAPLRPVALKPYQKAFLREMLDSTSTTKQVTVMKRADVGRTPLLFTAEELEIFGLSVETMPKHAIVVEDIWPPPVLPMVEFKGVYGKGDGV
ncbi:hypothetical protein [Agrobacterium tumefaciens]|uniref:hypothetical protein n=1 Tax=Agrobacterium tumefaciens TaxID=358 RepID=UPI0028617E46|nr:hypothetical protein [Agrobacterium tumefaciens]MDR6587416.1 hypothetical protein [Agrobacterium tumefaciens]